MLKRIKFKYVRAFMLSTLLMSPLAAEGIAGMWKTIDDETGQPKSLIEIKKVGEEYRGVIVELLNASEPNPICRLCEGERKDQPITGMAVMSGIKEVGDAYSTGEILDPQNGKLYSVNVKLLDDGKKLKVRGYIGVSLLGRTQIWQRDQ